MSVCVSYMYKIYNSENIHLKETFYVYGAPKKINCINKYRYLTFVKNTRNKKQVQLSCLPPTSASAHQHLYRVYYQVQTWLGNQLNPEDWGWKLTDNTLEPIQTILPPAPDKLLNTIFCNCKKGCGAKCGCRRVGLLCSAACSNCQGQSCSNVQLNPRDEDSCDIDEETADSSSVDQFMNIQQEEEEEEEEEEIEEDMTVEVEFEEYESD